MGSNVNIDFLRTWERTFSVLSRKLIYNVPVQSWASLWSTRVLGPVLFFLRLTGKWSENAGSYTDGIENRLVSLIGFFLKYLAGLY